MTDTGHFQTPGGAILLMDIPPVDTHARERFDVAVAAGELVPVDEKNIEEVVLSVDVQKDGTEVPSMGYRLKQTAADKKAEAKKADVESAE